MAPAREIHRRVRTGCITCRRRHMKCDERKPQCRHCEIGRRDCRYDFVGNGARRGVGNGSNGGFQFSPDHVWLETPSAVTFVHTVDLGDDEDESVEPSASTPLPGPSVHDSASPDPSEEDTLERTEADTGMDTGNDETETRATSAQTPLPPPPGGDTCISPPVVDESSPNVFMTEAFLRENSNQIQTPGRSRDSFSFASPHSTMSVMSMETMDPVKSLILKRKSGSTIYTQGPIEPVNDPQIARLLKHYVNNLACWLDLNDPQRQFETFVPYLALSCPILLHAILAFSACHLHRADTTFDAYCASHYHDLSVQGLIPALADPATALDNVLPISTVILRMYEMLSYEIDHQRHLRGCSSLFTHNRRNISFRALKRTAFWTYFREEIMVALATGKPTTIRPSNWKADITWGGDNDYVKTEKMTMLMAEIVDYCFAEDREDPNGDAHRWGELRYEVDTWKDNLPESFQPLYVIEDSKPFPEITYLCTWHIVAMQFYHLAKVLLALHNPRRTIGIGFLHYARSVEAETLKHTLQLCGMTKAIGDKQPGALVNALQPLIICGRSLKLPEQQTELVKMLERIERVTTLSAVQGIQSLREAWDLQGDY